MQKWISQAAAGSDTRRILVIVSMMGIFATTQALYGLRAGSLGLVSDSFHMFFHCAALLVSLIGMIASAERGASVSFSYSYGFDRHEVLASFSNALFLIFVGFFIIAGAVGRLFQPSLIEQSALIFEFGIAGLVLNVVGLVVLGPGQSAADHVRRFTKGGPAGGSSAKAAGALPTHQSRGPVSSARASNVDAVRLNFLSHTVSSLAVVASSLAVRYAGWLIADTIQSVAVAIFTLALAMPLARTTGLMLLQTVPESERAALERCRREAMTVPGLLELTDEHFWAQAPGFLVGSLTVRARAGGQVQAEVLERVSSIYRRVVEDMTVEVVVDAQLNTRPRGLVLLAAALEAQLVV